MTGFAGCVQYFNMTTNTLLVSEHSRMVDVWPSPSLIQSSCSFPGFCLPTPCSEEGAVCLSTNCQKRWRCGPAVRNRSCICLHNVSNHICDTCSSRAEEPDWCYEVQDNLPIWLIAVLLPLISMLVIIGMFAALYRARQRNSKYKKTQQQADNIMLYFHNNRAFIDESDPNTDPKSAYEQRPRESQFYCETNLSGVRLVPNSELEYYEIGSISSAHSESPSLKLGWHAHNYSTHGGKDDTSQWGDFKMLLAGFREELSSEDKAKPQNVASLNRQTLSKTDAHQSQNATFYCMETFLQPELLEHVQCLTFEEISKLNIPLESHLTPSGWEAGSTKSTTMIHVSFDSETNSTFTCSESEYKDFSVISTKEYIHDQPSLSASFPQQDSLPGNAVAGQCKSESTSSSMFVEWEKVLSIHPPFSSYATVFEEIARLPVEPCYDIQSDTEEII